VNVFTLPLPQWLQPAALQKQMARDRKLTRLNARFQFWSVHMLAPYNVRPLCILSISPSLGGFLWGSFGSKDLRVVKQHCSRSSILITPFTQQLLLRDQSRQKSNWSIEIKSKLQSEHISF
jgi:hypothetical protein